MPDTSLAPLLGLLRQKIKERYIKSHSEMNIFIYKLGVERDDLYEDIRDHRMAGVAKLLGAVLN